MFKLFEDKSILSATPVLFRFEDKQPRSIFDIILHKPYKPTAVYPDKKIIDYFRYYDIKTTKEIFNGQPTEKRILVCMVCGEYEHIAITLKKNKCKILCNNCNNKYKMED